MPLNLEGILLLQIHDKSNVLMVVMFACLCYTGDFVSVGILFHSLLLINESENIFPVTWLFLSHWFDELWCFMPNFEHLAAYIE